ncbi:MAG: M48 family metalloprotease [Candidatus Aminicenantes bacterium]|nr:M48 family metalloprotease [Candidatus Aminicenantes bacterium]
MHLRKILQVFIIVTGLFFLGPGCSVIEQGAGVLSKTGRISESDRQAVVETSKAFRRTFADITEEEEYFIGRAVAALILSKYGIYPDRDLTLYVNKVGNAVVFYSERPEIYDGYHFLILDTEEVNALSAPGGFVFITKGLLRRCRDEEMLACILAHEVGHISAKHGLRSIKNSRLIDAFQIMGQEAMRRYTSAELSRLTGIFEDVLADITESLVERGYDRKYEYEADSLAVTCAVGTGYNPQGLLDFLQTMVENPEKGQGAGWFRTHPRAEDRIKRISRQVSKLKSLPVKDDIRSRRFLQVAGSLK